MYKLVDQIQHIGEQSELKNCIFESNSKHEILSQGVNLLVLDIMAQGGGNSRRAGENYIHLTDIKYIYLIK